jgi:3'-5' exonuclease
MRRIGERSERDLIQAFADKIAERRPRLVTFNGSSFDLPVLRYRAMIHRISAPGLAARNYFNRYTDDALDLCDVLTSFDQRAKVSLHELCRVLGLPGKPDGIDGSQVEAYYRAGRIKEVAEYCESDVINTYRAWLRYELFRGALWPKEHDQSEANLMEQIERRRSTKQRLLDSIEATTSTLAVLRDLPAPGVTSFDSSGSADGRGPCETVIVAELSAQK